MSVLAANDPASKLTKRAAPKAASVRSAANRLSAVERMPDSSRASVWAMPCSKLRGAVRPMLFQGRDGHHELPAVQPREHHSQVASG